MKAALSYLKQIRPFLVVVMWAVIPALVAFGLPSKFPSLDDGLKKALFTGGATLLFGGLLMGVLKLLLDDVVAAKRRQEDAAEFVTNVLADLKSIYDQVGASRIVIPAHKSAKTYGQEMRGMIEARVRLRNVTRALEKRSAGLDDRKRQDVESSVKDMEKYLQKLMSEFRNDYKRLSDKQRAYEERAAAIVKEYAQATTKEDPPPMPDFVWKDLSSLPLLKDLIDEQGEKDKSSQYYNEFLVPLDAASETLRKEHARILRYAGVVYGRGEDPKDAGRTHPETETDSSDED